MSDRGYWYFIERNGSTMNNAVFEVELDGTTYDVVKSSKNLSLERLSTIIVNLDNNCFDKVLSLIHI